MNWQVAGAQSRGGGFKRQGAGGLKKASRAAGSGKGTPGSR
jgi:hypothetical protein